MDIDESQYIAIARRIEDAATTMRDEMSEMISLLNMELVVSGAEDLDTARALRSQMDNFRRGPLADFLAGWLD